MFFAEYIKQAFLLVIILSAIPLFVSSLAGLLVSFLQAATQIQEQSIVFVAKLAALSMALFLISGWGAQQIGSFVQSVFISIEELGRL